MGCIEHQMVALEAVSRHSGGMTTGMAGSRGTARVRWRCRRRRILHLWMRC
jgi:hypothetical protein